MRGEAAASKFRAKSGYREKIEKVSERIKKREAKRERKRMMSTYGITQ